MTTIQISDIFVDPDLVGEAEYRAIYDLLKSAWKDLDDDYPNCTLDEKLAFIISMLNEFIVSAEVMKRRVSLWKNRPTE